MNSRSVVRLSLGLAVASVAGSLVAGPLDPPAGPVTGSFKTLSEVEPRTAISATNTPGDNDATPSVFKITKSGSYYLASDVAGFAGKNGIEITANNVTLDLNGFTCKGVDGSLAGIRISGGGAVIRDGRVAGWGDAGVLFVAGSGS